MNKKQVVVRVYGDSLAMPRAFAGIVFTQTYAELFCKWLRTSFPEKDVYLYNRSRGGSDIKDLFAGFSMDSAYFGASGDSILILQLGIVDCVPRLLPVWAKKGLSRLPEPVKKRVIRFLHDNRPSLQRMGLGGRITSKKDFARAYKKWLAKASSEFRRIYVFNILPTTDVMERHSPGMSNRIKEYNALIKGVVQEISAHNIFLLDAHEYALKRPEGVECYVNKEDGHHLTLEGHKVYSELMIEHEKRLVET